MIFQGGANGAPPCGACHAVEIGGPVTRFDAGPNLVSIRERAATRIAGMSAEDYLRESVLHPGRYIVPTFRGAMYMFYADALTDQDMNDLLAYLLTL